MLTRGDIERNFPTSFLRDALVVHFSSEYVEVTGCCPDCVLIESLVKIFLKLWQILKKGYCPYFTTWTGIAVCEIACSCLKCNFLTKHIRIFPSLQSLFPSLLSNAEEGPYDSFRGKRNMMGKYDEEVCFFLSNLSPRGL